MAARKRTQSRKKKGSLVKKYGPFLEGLCHIPHRYRQKIIKESPKDVIDCVGECCLNIIKGNVRLSNAQKHQLRSRKNHIRLLSKKQVPVSHKKKIINQKGGFLLPLLGSVLAPILGGLFHHGRS